MIYKIFQILEVLLALQLRPLTCKMQKHYISSYSIIYNNIAMYACFKWVFHQFILFTLRLKLFVFRKIVFERLKQVNCGQFRLVRKITFPTFHLMNNRSLDERQHDDIHYEIATNIFTGHLQTERQTTVGVQLRRYSRGSRHRSRSELSSTCQGTFCTMLQTVGKMKNTIQSYIHILQGRHFVLL